jgi:hypothetical protein
MPKLDHQYQSRGVIDGGDDDDSNYRYTAARTNDRATENFVGRTVSIHVLTALALRLLSI